MRPLTVRMVWSSGPLFCKGLPVSGCPGGGGSRLRGVEAELDGGLEGRGAEVGEQVADMLLGLVDDVSGLGVVDGQGDALAELLEGGEQAVAEVLGGQLG